MVMSLARASVRDHFTAPIWQAGAMAPDEFLERTNECRRDSELSKKLQPHRLGDTILFIFFAGGREGSERFLERTNEFRPHVYR